MPDAVLTERPAETAAGLKVPPHSIEAEQSVLGGLLLESTAWDRVADLVAEADFYRPDHRLVFRAVHALAEAGKPCDVVTVSEWLASQDSLEPAGGLGYLGSLAKNTPSAANIVAYAEIVRERAVLRELARVGADIATWAFRTEGRSAEEVLDEAERSVLQIAERGTRPGGAFDSIQDVLVGVMDRIDTLHASGTTITGVPTGFTDLDDRTSGLQPGDLVIVAGRPSMGKTAFAMNVVEHAAIKEQLGVGVFSMEMPAEQLTMRLLASLGRINQHAVRTGDLHDDDWPRLTSAMELLNKTRIYIDDSGGLTPGELRTRCRRLKREHGLGLVVVDYLQLMHVPGTKENRATEISEISRALKGLAKELEVPVVALSQLNRGLEQRGDKRPMMADLRESGAIEQDADVILFIYRDEVYDKESKHKGKAEVNIGKQRNGPIGTVTLAFLDRYTRFENYIPDEYAGAVGGYSGPFVP